MILLKALVIVAGAVLTSGNETADQLCRRYGYSSPHTMCLLDNSPYFVKMETTSPDEILSLHNRWREQIADAIVPLRKLTWDNELAVLAERWSAQCPADHDVPEQRVVPRWDWVGQNQCFSNGYEVTWSDCIQAWASESAFFKYGVGSINGSDVGHYTQIIWQDTLTIGCAKSNCNNAPWDYVLTCNYGPGGNIGPFGQNHFARPYAVDPRKTGLPLLLKTDALPLPVMFPTITDISSSIAPPATPPAPPATPMTNLQLP